MRILDYLDPQSCPTERPSVDIMGEPTRSLHDAIDRAARARGIPYLHPRDRTLMLDLLGSARMTDWQEGKVSFLFEGNGCWSELPQVYARYGVETTRGLLETVRGLENAKAALLTDCGMQACALLFDVLVKPKSHAIIMRQVYNKTRKYVERLGELVGAEVSVVDDGDIDGLKAAVRKNTVLVFAETYTNPLTRAVDPELLGQTILALRKEVAPRLHLAIDNTIASVWGVKRPLLDYEGVHFVVASGTKSLGGQDRDLWGYIASNSLDAMNEGMDLQAMRGGILDWRRAAAIHEGLAEAQKNYTRRCQSATQVARFLDEHSLVEEVFHPSLPGHPDRETIERFYTLPGSLLSFRLTVDERDATEDECRHFADVLATTVVPRYALSFDGLATKVNHHLTVSEYFTPVEELERAGIDRLVRLGIGLEEPDDINACLNWALWHHRSVSADEVSRWQADRAKELGIYQGRQAP